MLQGAWAVKLMVLCGFHVPSPLHKDVINIHDNTEVL